MCERYPDEAAEREARALRSIPGGWAVAGRRLRQGRVQPAWREDECRQAAIAEQSHFIARSTAIGGAGEDHCAGHRKGHRLQPQTLAAFKPHRKGGLPKALDPPDPVAFTVRV